MRTLVSRGAALGAALLFCAVGARSGWTCSVCQAGDPIFSGGAAAPHGAGTLSAYIEYQGYRKTSGLLAEQPGDVPEEGREVNEGRQTTAFLSWGISDRLTLSAQLPFRWNRISEEPAAEDRHVSRLTGAGDLSLTLGYVLWRNRDVLPSTWLEGRWFGKAPTGQREQRADGKVDPHLQLGSGSWDFGAGFGAGHHLEWGSLYASFLYRINRQGALRYTYGDVVLANLAVEAPLDHVLQRARASGITAGLELNFRHAGRDDFAGHAYGDSGGSLVYATPSLRLKLPGVSAEYAPSLRFAAQLPLGQSGLRGQQHEGIVWSIGLAMSLK